VSQLIHWLGICSLTVGGVYLIPVSIVPSQYKHIVLCTIITGFFALEAVSIVSLSAENLPKAAEYLPKAAEKLSHTPTYFVYPVVAYVLATAAMQYITADRKSRKE
jgi:hypothetical protein